MWILVLLNVLKAEKWVPPNFRRLGGIFTHSEGILNLCIFILVTK